MKKILCGLMAILLLSLPVSASVLPQGTPVIVQAQRKIIADNVKEGNTVAFIVTMPVKSGDKVVIKAGTEIQGKVLSKKNNNILGLPGHLEVGNFEIIEPNGNVIHLRGSILDEGEGRYWANIGWFFVFPLLFVKGNDGEIRPNLQHTLYTLEDINF